METKKNKQEFFTTLKNEINHRETLREFYNTAFQELLKKFDGKVYNKRFETALNDALKAVSPSMWCRCEQQGRDSYSNFPDCPRVQIILSYRNTNYNDNESFYTNIVLNYDPNYNARINAEDSAREKYTIAWAANFDKTTEENRNILKNYDKYIKVADKMAEAVANYNKLPARFRENIFKNYIAIY